MKDKKTNDNANNEILRVAVERLRNAITDEHDNRTEALDDFKFVHGDQWPEELRAEREAEGRPCLTINRLRQFVKQVVGDQRQNRPSPKFLPVDDDADPMVADIIEELHRHMWYHSFGDSAMDKAFEHAFECGVGYWRLLHDYIDNESFHQDIMVQTIRNPFSVYLDQSWNKEDFTDMRFAFITDLIPKEQFKAEYGDIAVNDVDNGIGDYDGFGEWLSEGTVRIAEYYWVDESDDTLYMLPGGRTILKSVAEEEDIEVGVYLDKRKTKRRKVMWAKICGSQILEGPVQTPSKYIPIIPVFGDDINVNGKRMYKGGIRDAKDPQKIYNYQQSTNIEMLALQPKSPIIVEKEAIEGHETQWNNHNVKPYPYLMVNGKKMTQAPHRVQPPSMSQGIVEQMSRSEADMKATTGIYDAALGNRGNETSGKAILARQRESDTATFTFIDNLMKAVKYHGMVFLDMLPKIYDAERIIRLEREDGSNDSAKINEVAFVEGVFTVLNDLTVGKYDVRVTAGPSYMTQRIEAMESMLEFARAFPLAQQVIPDLAAANLDFKNVDQIQERLKALLPPGVVNADKIAEMKRQGKDGGMEGMPPEMGGPNQPEGEQPQPPDPTQMIKAQLMQQKGQQDMQKGQIDMQLMALEVEKEKIAVRQKEVDLQTKQLQLAGEGQKLQQDQVVTEEMIQKIAAQVMMMMARANGMPMGNNPYSADLPSVPNQGRF